MIIRRAKNCDSDGINKLLFQVAEVHHKGRPDLFRKNGKKYKDEELLSIIRNDMTPVFVAVDEKEQVLGYAFCIFQTHTGSLIFTDIKTLYIDDLCVDEALRGQHIGRQLYDAVVSFARESGCYNITLNVWSCNEAAQKFYEGLGLQPQKTGMEFICGTR